MSANFSYDTKKFGVRWHCPVMEARNHGEGADIPKKPNGDLLYGSQPLQVQRACCSRVGNISGGGLLVGKAASPQVITLSEWGLVSSILISDRGRVIDAAALCMGHGRGRATRSRIPSNDWCAAGGRAVIQRWNPRTP